MMPEGGAVHQTFEANMCDKSTSSFVAIFTLRPELIHDLTAAAVVHIIQRDPIAPPLLRLQRQSQSYHAPTLRLSRLSFTPGTRPFCAAAEGMSSAYSCADLETRVFKECYEPGIGEKADLLFDGWGLVHGLV
jgi:hypothetical protein